MNKSQNAIFKVKFWMIWNNDFELFIAVVDGKNSTLKCG